MNEAKDNKIDENIEYENNGYYSKNTDREANESARSPLTLGLSKI